MFRILIDPPLDGATNMARDEALLVLHAHGEAPPTLRLYQWSPACLSLGRFQRSGEIDRALTFMELGLDSLALTQVAQQLQPQLIRVEPPAAGGHDAAAGA